MADEYKVSRISRRALVSGGVAIVAVASQKGSAQQLSASGGFELGVDGLIGEWVATDKSGRNLGSLTISDSYNSLKANHLVGHLRAKGGAAVSLETLREGEAVFVDKEGFETEVRIGGRGNWLAMQLPDEHIVTFRKKSFSPVDPRTLTAEVRRNAAYWDSYEDLYYDYTDTYWDQRYFDYYDGTR